MTAITDHNYNWRLHRRVWLAWPGPGSQLRTEDESGLSGVREGRGACSVCQLPIHHGDTGANMEHGVMLINIYPQCSHYYQETRWIVLVLINMGHIGLHSGLNITLYLSECLNLSIISPSTLTKLGEEKEDQGVGCLCLMVWWPVSCPTSLTPGSPQPRRRRRGNWYLRFCFNSSLLVCIQIRYAGSFSHIV